MIDKHTHQSMCDRMTDFALNAPVSVLVIMLIASVAFYACISLFVSNGAEVIISDLKVNGHI